MKALDQLVRFIEDAQRHDEMKPLHVSLYLAIHNCWVSSGCTNPIFISRKVLMHLSKIESIATYHKALKTLCELRYIIYHPSYDPRMRSTVYISSLIEDVASAKFD